MMNWVAKGFLRQPLTAEAATCLFDRYLPPEQTGYLREVVAIGPRGEVRSSYWKYTAADGRTEFSAATQRALEDELRARGLVAYRVH